MNIASEKLNVAPMDLFNQVLENLKPVLEVKARRVGGSTYQVPIEIRPARRQTLALRWLVAAARNRNDRTMAAKLAGEMMDAYNSTGNAFKKKEDVHRMAEANKAFASYRW
jgi:small subunit ribosomal protein S7